jgi:hypothetical protein
MLLARDLRHQYEASLQKGKVKGRLGSGGELDEHPLGMDEHPRGMDGRMEE